MDGFDPHISGCALLTDSKICNVEIARNECVKELIDISK